MKVEIFYSKRHQAWMWRIKARNGQIVCNSAEGFVTKGNCKRAIRKTIESIFTRRPEICEIGK